MRREAAMKAKLEGLEGQQVVTRPWQQLGRRSERLGNRPGLGTWTTHIMGRYYCIIIQATSPARGGSHPLPLTGCLP